MAVKGLPVVTAANGKGLPVVVLPSGGVPVTEASNGLGTPIVVATNGYGLAVTMVT